jgi:hypothetical protein
MRELEAKLLHLGVVSLHLSARGDEYHAVARCRGGRTAVVTSGVSLELAVGRALAVLEIESSRTTRQNQAEGSNAES